MMLQWPIAGCKDQQLCIGLIWNKLICVFCSVKNGWAIRISDSQKGEEKRCTILMSWAGWMCQSSDGRDWSLKLPKIPLKVNLNRFHDILCYFMWLYRLVHVITGYFMLSSQTQIPFGILDLLQKNNSGSEGAMVLPRSHASSEQLPTKHWESFRQPYRHLLVCHAEKLETRANTI